MYSYIFALSDSRWQQWAEFEVHPHEAPNIVHICYLSQCAATEMVWQGTYGKDSCEEINYLSAATYFKRHNFCTKRFCRCLTMGRSVHHRVRLFTLLCAGSLAGHRFLKWGITNGKMQWNLSVVLLMWIMIIIAQVEKVHQRWDLQRTHKIKWVTVAICIKTNNGLIEAVA